MRAGSWVAVEIRSVEGDVSSLNRGEDAVDLGGADGAEPRAKHRISMPEKASWSLGTRPRKLDPRVITSSTSVIAFGTGSSAPVMGYLLIMVGRARAALPWARSGFLHRLQSVAREGRDARSESL